MLIFIKIYEMSVTADLLSLDRMILVKINQIVRNKELKHFLLFYNDSFFRAINYLRK